MKSSQRTEAIERFYENRLFDGVDVDVIERIVPKIGVFQKEPGEVIFREGEPGDSLYLVGQGAVRISKLADTADQEILDYVDQGNFFGAVALLAREPHSTTATAIQPALIGEVKEETFEELLELAPSRLHVNFLRAVATRVHSANAHFMRETVKAERMRVASALASAIIHDLKNPVRIARCCSDLIANESADPQLRELSGMLADAVNKILGLTLDLLEYTRRDCSQQESGLNLAAAGGNQSPLASSSSRKEHRIHQTHSLSGEHRHRSRPVRACAR